MGVDGKTKLVWSPVQLRLMNQHKIVPIGHLTGVPMNIDGVCNMVDFEVIEIMDGKSTISNTDGTRMGF
jgi:small nuclear ribonucleoprotein (snRNP)-like protein